MQSDSKLVLLTTVRYMKSGVNPQSWFLLGDGQGGLVCCDSWGRRVRHDWATELNWTECWRLTLQEEHCLLNERPLRGIGCGVIGIVICLLSYNYNVGSNNICVVSESRREGSIWGYEVGKQIDKTFNLAPYQLEGPEESKHEFFVPQRGQLWSTCLTPL